MAYAVHWVWLGGRLADGVRANILAWTSGSKRFGDGIQPVLWVDQGAFDRLTADHIAVAAFPSIELGGGIIAKHVLTLPDQRATPRIAVVNISRASGEWRDVAGDGQVHTWHDARGILGQVGVPRWDRLQPAMVHETTDANGLPQVASDIVRIAVLWLLGGAYWDLGDTAPGNQRFSEASVRTAMNAGGNALDVTPQVLEHAGTYRTENGIILTHPDRLVNGRAHYQVALDGMWNRYTTAHDRTDAVQGHIDTWRNNQVLAVTGKLGRDRNFVLAHGANPTINTDIDVQAHLVEGHAPPLAGVTTMPTLDRVLTTALARRGQTDKVVSRLIWSALRENESAYLTCMQFGLGGQANIGPLLENLSDTVDLFTFRPFVTEMGTQVAGGTTAVKAQNLYTGGWNRVRAFFGGATKIGSWYSWKTRPARMIVDVMAAVDDQAVDENDAFVWPAKAGECKLCLARTTSLHHCRRCGNVMCGDCGAKVRHVQPRGSAAARIWNGNEWACVGCIAIFKKRQA